MINCKNNVLNLSKKKFTNQNEKKNKIDYEKNVVFLTIKKWKFPKKCCNEKKNYCENNIVIKKK